MLCAAKSLLSLALLGPCVVWTQVSSSADRHVHLGVNLIVKVTDQHNASVVAAVVRLQGPGAFERTSSTDSKGDCFFGLIPPGEYVVIVSLGGPELQREDLVVDQNEASHFEQLRVPIVGVDRSNPVSALDLSVPRGAMKNYAAGISNIHKAKWGEAEANFQTSITQCPTYMRAFNALGVALVMQERYLEAESAFRKATALDDKFGEAHLNLGNLLLRENREREAIDELRKVIGTEPTNEQALGLLGQAYLSVQSDEEAVQLLGYVDARNVSHDPQLHFRLAQLLETHERRENAIAEYRRYLAEAPDAAHSEDARRRIRRLAENGAKD